MTTSIIVLPGGGYHRHAPHEGEPVAEWLRGIGFASRVVEYPVLTRHPGPLRTVQAEIARERASGATRVGVLGFSAGGHLAGLAALARGGPHPDFAVLCYPVVSMLLPTHRGSRENLIGLRAGWLKRRSVSLDKLVTPQSPPMFLWHTIEDAGVPVEHSYLLAAALAKKKVQHELHAFAEGEHGIGFATGLPAEAWRSLCELWLERLR